MDSRRERVFVVVYACVVAAQVALVTAKDGVTADDVTRLAIVAFLAAQLAWWWRTRHVARASTQRAFVVRGVASALVVEACYMISRPVFASLLVTRDTSVVEAISNTLIDFAFTLPAYVALFVLIWAMLQRFRYSIAEYMLVFSFAQACGDGNAFFAANPAMLLFAPWLMLNYQAMNVVPFLVARPHLRGELRSPARFFLPLLTIPLAYWCLGALIKLLGRAVGLE